MLKQAKGGRLPPYEAAELKHICDVMDAAAGNQFKVNKLVLVQRNTLVLVRLNKLVVARLSTLITVRLIN